MSDRVGRMISLEIGVSDVAFGAEIAAMLTAASSPSPGATFTIADGVVLTYLRSFEITQPSSASDPAVWVGFSIRYDENASADPIVEWLMKSLEATASHITLKVDTSRVPVEKEALTKLVRSKVEESV